MTKPKIIQQGAEAKIILSNNFIIKDRIKKNYRIKELDDAIRKRRTKSEAKLLEKASRIINAPMPFFQPTSDVHKIKMPYIRGKELSNHLDNFSLKNQKEICKLIGENVAKLHDSNIIHGDLTTSNMILKKDKIYFIDFGLGFISHKFEDKAVDLHLLRQALEAKHFKNWEVLFEEVLKGYSKSKDFKVVLERLKAVEKRGRYKEKY